MVLWCIVLNPEVDRFLLFLSFASKRGLWVLVRIASNIQVFRFLEWEFLSDCAFS